MGKRCPSWSVVKDDFIIVSPTEVSNFDEVLQLHNAAIERFETAIVGALVSQLQPAGILLRADSRSRREQKLTSPIKN